MNVEHVYIGRVITKSLKSRRGEGRMGIKIISIQGLRIIHVRKLKYLNLDRLTLTQMLTTKIQYEKKIITFEIY